MIIGLDFDNTIVSYDALFWRVAREQALIPASVAATKHAVREHLRAAGREQDWTVLQGAVYGARMAEAEPSPGVLEFFAAARRTGHRLIIVSHKTRQPIIGAPFDLHAAARNWLERIGVFSENGAGLARADVFFELTKPAKLARIADCGCDVFVDDLPEILDDPQFPDRVGRLLFDPYGAHTDSPSRTRVRDWGALAAMFITRTPCSAKSDFGLPEEASIEVIAGGANNRVTLVRSRDGRLRVRNEYFSHPADPRDRFRTEREFYCYAWETAGIRSIPQPLGWDEHGRRGVFEFVTGRKVTAAELDNGAFEAAARFIAELNHKRHHVEALALPRASEACFSTDEHLTAVDQRLERLGGLGAETPLGAAVRNWVHEELAPAWRCVRADARRITRDGGAGSGTEAWVQRCISPSDFGFHNALVRPEGSFAFFDFEYAGWDDPAKLVCDFFCQPAVPVPAAWFDPFAHRVATMLSIDPAAPFVARCSALLPVYRIKWCGIMLNEFVPASGARRSFALGAQTMEQRLSAQFARARAALEQLHSPVH